MADQDNSSPSPSSSPRATTRVSFSSHSFRKTNLSRRQSANERRINEILESARERAEAMGSSASTSRSPVTSPALLARGRPTRARVDEHDSSADERTGIVGSGTPRNYESTTTQTGTGPRPRNVNGHRSYGGSDDGELPPPQLDADRNENRESTQTTPWHVSILDSFRSIELENKGSVARDHLALERTFLAWLRTSLAFASIGIAVTQLFRLNTSLSDSGGARDPNTQTLRRLGKPLGATFLSISIAVLFLGYRRYFQAQKWVIKGKFPASRGTIILVSIVALAVMVISLIVVIVVQPTSPES